MIYEPWTPRRFKLRAKSVLSGEIEATREFLKLFSQSYEPKLRELQSKMPVETNDFMGHVESRRLDNRLLGISDIALASVLIKLCQVLEYTRDNALQYLWYCFEYDFCETVERIHRQDFGRILEGVVNQHTTNLTPILSELTAQRKKTNTPFFEDLVGELRNHVTAPEDMVDKRDKYLRRFVVGITKLHFDICCSALAQIRDSLRNNPKRSVVDLQVQVAHRLCLLQDDRKSNWDPRLHKKVGNDLARLLIPQTHRWIDGGREFVFPPFLNAKEESIRKWRIPPDLLEMRTLANFFKHNSGVVGERDKNAEIVAHAFDPPLAFRKNESVPIPYRNMKLDAYIDSVRVFCQDLNDSLCDFTQEGAVSVNFSAVREIRH
ncbi:hypothetical protein KQI84_05755 [bacterium]|nr:hypothetical protein [bacterium]